MPDLCECRSCGWNGPGAARVAHGSSLDCPRCGSAAYGYPVDADSLMWAVAEHENRPDLTHDAAFQEHCPNSFGLLSTIGAAEAWRLRDPMEMM
jgi:hypothetical protein